MATHSLLAPSAAERWINCPASVVMSEPFPDTVSEYAAEGTTAHKLAELKIRSSILGEEVDGKEVDKVKRSKYYNPDMEDYTDEYVEYVRSLVNSNETTVLPETRLNLNFITQGTVGTADCILAFGNELHVIDFKYGKNVEVNAQDNPQLKIYGLGACNLIDGLIYNIENVTVHIAQPRMNNFSSMTLTKKELNDWLKDEVRPQAIKAVNGTAETAVGNWCQFCRAKTVCRKYGERFDVDYKPDNPNTLSNEEIAERIIRLSGLDGYLKDLKKYALDKILDGETFPGLKAVAGRSVRTWTNQEEAFRIAQENGYDHSVLFEQVPLSLAKVEKMMSKRKFNELLSDYVDKPPGKPTLVSENDPRESIVTESVDNDFTDVDINKIDFD